MYTFLYNTQRRKILFMKTEDHQRVEYIISYTKCHDTLEDIMSFEGFISQGQNS